jgi:broad specificity phosphatase PhoE
MAHPELFIIRHGETHWNREGRFQGALDSALTDLGRAQAVAMGRTLAARGQPAPGVRLYCSPQGRAMATAALAFPGHAVTPDSRLAEIGMGAWSGLTREEIALRWPGPDDEDVFDLYARCPGGESQDALWDRVAAFLGALAGPAIIVTHGFTSRFLRACALGLTPDQAGEMPGGQGVIHHLRGGTAALIAADGLPEPGPAARPLL